MGEVEHISSTYRNPIGLIKNKPIGTYREIYEEPYSKSQEKQHSIAVRLLDKLGEPKSWKFYLYCAYRLPESKIWEFVEIALGPDTRTCPNNRFVFLANREIHKNNQSTPPF